MNAPDLVQLMRQKAEAVQAVVSEIANFDQACRYAADLTRNQGGRNLAAAGFNAGKMDLLTKRCESAGLNFLRGPLRRHADDIHTALTSVDWGIAETGSLVIDSRSEDTRIATMLCDSHVAVLPATRIRPDAMSLEKELQQILKGKGPAYTAFITGASRTADIERVLAIGVHGPKELHILIMEENEK